MTISVFPPSGLTDILISNRILSGCAILARFLSVTWWTAACPSKMHITILNDRAMMRCQRILHRGLTRPFLILTCFSKVETFYLRDLGELRIRCHTSGCRLDRSVAGRVSLCRQNAGRSTITPEIIEKSRHLQNLISEMWVS